MNEFQGISDASLKQMSICWALESQTKSLVLSQPVMEGWVGTRELEVFFQSTV